MSNLDLIIKLVETDSTNKYGLSHFDNLSDKQVIVADTQTSGRGRFDRRWVADGTSNVYMSIILKPDSPDYPFANLTQYLALSLVKTLKRHYDVDSSLKWPNDVLVDGAKIAGILCEAASSQNKIKGLVLGIGVNLNMKKQTLENIDQCATSLNLLLNKTINRDVFLKQLLDEFASQYDEFVSKGFRFIKQEYIEYCTFLNKKISIKQSTANAENKTNYTALSINDDGSLHVLDQNNNECDIITGDMTC
ncbi:MAG: biotin--[acetyl-CoA-carboxylase] ligase [Candidatus Gastranaerophilales bacterium]|nr:biotin--[acetyl-CoA-carboxylase] ligase [Candidatus Gastranaerophilales bacterium]